MIYAVILLLALSWYFSFRYAWWKKTVSYAHPRILMYHMIRPPVRGAHFNSLRVSPASFSRQVKHLRDAGWTFFTMAELLAHKDNLPEKSVAITFDDGYEDNFSNALPVLRKYGAKATLYLVTDRHNKDWSLKRKSKNNSGELMREPKLQDHQIREMIASGLIEIASHTCTHDNLTTISAAQKYHEICASKLEIEQTFGIQCVSFCYPFGLFAPTDLEILREAGYTNATTTEKGISDLRTESPFLLKRITISGKDNFPAFLLKLKTGKRGVKK